MNYAILLLAIAVPVLVWQIFRYPFAGLLLMLAVNPVEALIPLPAGISAGRLAGVVAVTSWLWHLHKDPSAWQRLKQSPLLRRIWAFPVICLAGALISRFELDNPKSVSLAVNVGLLAFMALMIDNQVDERKKIDQLMLVVILSSLVAVLFPLAYHFGYDLYAPVGFDAESAFQGGGRVRGLTNNANALGIATSMGLFALLIHINAQRRLRQGLLFAGISLAMLGGLVLSGSRTHLMALFVCLVAFMGMRMLGPARGRFFSVVAVLAIVALVPLAYLIAPESVQARLVVVGKNVDSSTWDRVEFSQYQREQAWGMVAEHPFLGVGLYGFRLRWTTGLSAHDSVSVLLGETGLLGTVALLWLVGACVCGLARVLIGWQRHGDVDLYYYGIGFLASLIAMLVGGLGGYVVFYQRWFWIVIGMSGVLLNWAAEAERLRGIRGTRPGVPWYGGGVVPGIAAVPAASPIGGGIRQEGVSP